MIYYLPKVRVLLLQAGSIGDIFYTFLVGEVIKKEIPDAVVDLMTIPPALSLGEIFSTDEVLPFKGKLGSALTIRGRGYDYLIDYEATFKTHVVSFFSGVPNRVAFFRNKREERLQWIRVYNRMIPYRKTPHTFWDRLELLKALGIDPSGYIEDRYLPRISPLPSYLEEVSKWIESRLGGKEFILLFTEGKGTTKRIPFEKQEKLIPLLKSLGYQIVIAVEGKFYDRYEEAYKDDTEVHIFSDKNLQKVIALTHLASGIISVEAFPYHVAVMLRKPVFVIDTMGVPWLPPTYEKGMLLGKNLDCQYCGERDCPTGTFECLTYWDEEFVVNSLLKLMGKA